MGKKREKRVINKQVGLSEHGNIAPDDDKLTLTRYQLSLIIDRVRISQMSEDAIDRQTIKKRIGCSQKSVDRWRNVGFDIDVMLDKPRTGRNEKTTPQLEKLIIRKSKSKKFSLRKCERNPNVNVKRGTIKNILNDYDIQWYAIKKVGKLTDQHKQDRESYCREWKDRMV